MAKQYQPRIEDRDRSIRKGVDRLYKKTRMSNARIVEMALSRGLAVVTSELVESQEGK